MPPKMRVEKGQIKSSRSFYGLDSDIAVSTAAIGVPIATGADFVIPVEPGQADEAAILDLPPPPPAEEFQPVDGDYEPCLTKFFEKYEPSKKSEVALYLEHWKGREEMMMQHLIHRFTACG